MPTLGIGCGILNSPMASDISLADFANRPQSGKAWVDDLPDDVYNQVWDARHSGSIGKQTVALWLRSIGFDDATEGRVETVLTRERR